MNSGYGIRHIQFRQLRTLKALETNGLKSIVESNFLQCASKERIAPNARDGSRNVNGCQARTSLKQPVYNLGCSFFKCYCSKLSAPLERAIRTANFFQTLGNFNRCQRHTFVKRQRANRCQPLGQIHLPQIDTISESISRNRSHCLWNDNFRQKGIILKCTEAYGCHFFPIQFLRNHNNAAASCIPRDGSSAILDVVIKSIRSLIGLHFLHGLLSGLFHRLSRLCLLRGGLRLLGLVGHLSLFRDLRGLLCFLGGRFRFLSLLLWQLLGHGFFRGLELHRFRRRGQHQLGCQHQRQEQAQCSSSHGLLFLLFDFFVRSSPQGERPQISVSF